MRLKVMILLMILSLILNISGCNDKPVELEADIINISNADYLFEGYEGCFILYNHNLNQYYVINEERVDIQLTPCSTFKIYNSLIGLETNVIEDADSLYEWNGYKHMYESWNQDHTLRSAIANSVAWYYQRLAEEVGIEKMQYYLKLIEYGNQDISGGITEFWLESSLEISPREQVELLNSLYSESLPFEEKHISIVKDVLTLEKTDEYILSGKTGSGINGIGWFIGVVEKDDNIYYFATNIEADENANGYQAKMITMDILESLGLY